MSLFRHFYDNCFILIYFSSNINLKNMNIKLKLITFLLFAVFSVNAATPENKKMDFLTLQNNMIFQGKIISIKNQSIIFKAGGKKYEVPASDIYSIKFGNLNDRVYKKHIELDDVNKCLTARLDAENYHGKKGGHFVLGLFFGPFAMIGTALANPTPYKGKNTYMMSENKELFNDPEYLSCYKSKARGQLLLFEGIGWAASILILLNN